MDSLIRDIFLTLILGLISIAAVWQLDTVVGSHSMLHEIQTKQVAMEKRIINIEKWTVPVGEETKDEVLLPQK